MKKMLACLVAVGTLLGTATPALADDHSQDTIQVPVVTTTESTVTEINPGYLWVGYHSGPGTSFPVVGHLNAGDQATFVSTTNYWWTEIDINGQDFYISNPLTFETTITNTTTTYVTEEAPWKVQADSLIASAKTQLGVPYWLDHQVANVGFDCSNFVAWSYKQIGISFSGASQWQRYNLGTPVALSDIREGDVLFFATAGDPNGGGHVGIYMGDGYVIQCGGGWGKVTIEPLATTWLGRNLVFARRVIN